jgi:hypothetical protein
VIRAKEHSKASFGAIFPVLETGSIDIHLDEILVIDVEGPFEKLGG